MKFRHIGLLFGMLFLLFSCGVQYSGQSDSNSVSVSSISGSVPSLVGTISKIEKNSFYAYAAVCEAEVSLYALDNNDEIVLPAISTAPVNTDGSFTLSVQSNAISDDKVNHILEVATTGTCDELLQRPLTQPTTHQVITPFSTVVAFSREAGLAKKLNEVSKVEMEGLLDGTATIINSTDAYTTLTTSKSAEFNVIFSDTPTKLAEATPVVKEKLLPSGSINEGSVNNFKITAYHWKPSYDVAVEWKLDGATVSTTPTWNFTPGGDSSGTKSLEVYVGVDDGSGSVDITKPYHYFTQSFAINNNLLPSPPALNFASTVVATNNITISMLTGAGMVNCQTFDGLAASVDDSSVPLFFLIDCTSPNAQDLTVNLPAGDGVKTIRLWARDHEGEISSAPSVLQVTLDQTGPTINLTAPTGTLRGGQTVSIPVSFSDAHTVSSANLYYSNDNGATFTHVSSITTSATSYSWTVPSVDSTQVQVKIVAADSLGNASTVISSNFAIDSTPPSAPTLSLNSVTPTNSTSVTVGVSSCAGYSAFILTESSTTPSLSDSSWTSCSSTLSYTLSNTTNGTRRVYAFGRDAAGNISSSSFVDLVFDNVAPSESILRLDSSTPTNVALVGASASDCTGVSHILLSTSSSAPSLSDGGWTVCSTTASTITGTITGGSGNKSFYAFAKDSAGNISAAQTLTIAYDITPPTLTSVIINPTTADPNVGEEYTGTLFTTVAVKYSEATAGSSVKLSMADPATGVCTQDGTSWVTYSDTGNISKLYNYQISSSDGTKKVCAWVKDHLGNESTHTGNTGTLGVDMDTIKFEIGNIPQVTSFSVKNSGDDSTNVTSGNDITISWQISDVEGLSNNPISLEYSTDNLTWNPLLDSSNSPITNYGGLSGYPTTYNSSLVTKAISSSYFRIRMKVVDKAGNDSVSAYSNPLNTGNWKIYAGSTDTGIGNSAKATSFSNMPNYSNNTFIFDPLRGDLYVKDHSSGIIKIDIKTGKSSYFLKKHGTTANLPDSGIVDINTHKLAEFYSFDFSPDGYMYLNVQLLKNQDRSKLYRLNPATMEIQYIAGGGSEFSDLSNSSSLNTIWGMLAVDESGNSYLPLHCTANATVDTASTSTAAFNILKITPAGVATHVAGNCLKENTFATAGPKPATSTSVGLWRYPSMSDIAVKDNGNVIVYQNYAQAYITKIVNGVMYKSPISSPITGVGLKFRSDGKLILVNGSIKVVNLDTTSSNADTVVSTVIGNDFTLPNCHLDGVHVNSACTISQFRVGFTTSGQLMFADGPIINAFRKYRIRYIDEQNLVQTFAGTFSLFGDGADKSVLRGEIGSIYYQKSSTANADFPEGLYFGAPEMAAVFYINPTTGVVERFLGNGLGAGSVALAGSVMNKNANLGPLYGAGQDGAIFNFDSSGYPFIRANYRLFRVGPGKIFEYKMTGSTNWDDATPGSSPALAYTPALSLRHNLALKGNGIFLLGVASSGTGSTSGNNSSSLRFMDFASNSVVHIMGGNGTNAYSADQTVDTDLRTLNINTNYAATVSNYTYYDQSTDRLYFVENYKKLRYITAPTSNSSKLITFMDLTGNSQSLWNFTFRPDGSSIFYIRDDGKLYCKTLGTAPASCNDTSLGPSTGLPTLGRGTNQLTWKDNNTLLVTNGSIIMEYSIPF